MKSFFKKLAFVMALAMVVSMAAPAARTAFAATEFYYAKQNTTEKVPTLSMKVGDEVDLCFIGVKNYKNYTLKWLSSNEAVATVDKNGIVTAVADGVATVELKVGDGTAYTSTPVVVTVGNVKNVLLGTSKTDTFTEKKIQINDTSVDLNFFGIADWNSGKNYKCQWISTDMKVATVNKVGLITPVAAGKTAIWFLATNTVTNVSYAAKVDVTIVDSDSFTVNQIDMETIELTFAEGVDMSTATEKDFVFMAVTGEGVPAKEIKADKIVGEKNVVTVTFAEDTLEEGTNLQIICGNKQTGVSIVKAEEKIDAKQLTATTVLVQFVNEHSFDATGLEELENNEFKTVKLYRKFTTEEMAKMGNKNGLKFDEEGNGYQAYYVKDTSVLVKENPKKYEEDPTVWVIEGYNAFEDGATYTVVYGKNETSSTLDGIKQDFVAYVGKVSYIKVTATNATVENDVEPAIAAVLTTRLYNSHNIDLTDYYKNADETDYEIVGDAKIDASISNNEVTFDEPGSVVVKGTYTFYDEDKEEDVPLSGETRVFGSPYPSYKVEAIYNWTLKSGYKDKWSATTNEMIAGDSDRLYVIVVDNRGNYYSNVPDIETRDYYINGKKVLRIGDGVENTPFEQYGYELVFDSLDPDSLLVNVDGAVESYKKTDSFAVVSYRNKDVENAKLHEIGVMGIRVKEARKLKSVAYTNGTSFTILKETEAEDGKKNYYVEKQPSGDFKTSAELKVEFKNQYGGKWDSKAVDYYDVVTNFTVTTTKNEFKDIAEEIAANLNDSGSYIIKPAMFADTTTTSVSFKIKESATGNSQTVTIKLDEPKYTDDDKTEVYVDPTRAILETGDVGMYTALSTSAKLFQVSKATQKIGYFRIGDLEDTPLDDKRGYYIGNNLPKDFVQPASASSSAITFASTSALKQGDYILVVTDPSGKVFPAQGAGGNGKSFGSGSKLGIVPNSDGTGYRLVVAAVRTDEGHEGEMEYAATGTYRATVYKVTNIAENKNTNGTVISYKYNTTRVSSDSFNVTKITKDLVFYHQEVTKDVELPSIFASADKDGTPDESILKAIAKTMTFRLDGKDVVFGAPILDANGDVVGYRPDDEASYRSFVKFDDGSGEYEYRSLRIKIASVEYKVQNNGKRAVIDTITVKIYTPVGGYYLSKVKVNRSVNVKED